jgi:hypothetical protein
MQQLLEPSRKAKVVPGIGGIGGLSSGGLLMQQLGAPTRTEASRASSGGTPALTNLESSVTPIPMQLSAGTGKEALPLYSDQAVQELEAKHGPFASKSRVSGTRVVIFTDGTKVVFKDDKGARKVEYSTATLGELVKQHGRVNSAGQLKDGTWAYDFADGAEVRVGTPKASGVDAKAAPVVDLQTRQGDRTVASNGIQERGRQPSTGKAEATAVQSAATALLQGAPIVFRSPAVKFSTNRQDVIQFTGSQSVSGAIVASPGSLISGKSNTTMTVDQSQSVLHTGAVLIDVPKFPVKIGVLSGQLTVLPSSSVAVTASGNLARIAAIAGSAKVSFLATPLSSSSVEQYILCSGGANRTQELTIQAGESVIIALNPKTEKGNREAGRRIVRGSFSVKDALARANRDGMLFDAPVDGRSSVLQRTAKVVLGESLHCGTRPNATHIIAADRTVFYEDIPGVLSLVVGGLFIDPSSRTTVNVDGLKIMIDKGELATVEVSKLGTRIRACSADNGVNVQLGNSSVNLTSGTEMFITDRKPDKDDLSPRDGIARRQVSVYLAGAKNVVMTDFSIVSMINKVPYLKALLHPTASIERNEREKLLKTAAALHIATGARGRFHIRPNESASLPKWLFSRSNFQS